MSNSKTILALYDKMRMQAFMNFGDKWHLIALSGEEDTEAKAQAIVMLEQELESLDHQKEGILGSIDDNIFGNDEEGQHGRNTSKKPPF